MEIEEQMTQATTLQDQGQGSQAAAIFASIADDRHAAGDSLTAGKAAQGEGIGWKIENDFEKAQAAFARALAYYEEAGSTLDVGRVHRDMGIVCMDHDRIEAVAHFDQSIKILQDLAAQNPGAKETAAELGISYAKRALLHAKNDNNESAEADFTEALKQIRSSEHAFYEMTALLHLATLRHKQVRHDEALQLLQEAESIIDQKLGREAQTRRLAEIEACRARCLLAMGNKDAATTAYHNSVAYMTNMSPAARDLVATQLELYKTKQALDIQ